MACAFCCCQGVTGVGEVSPLPGFSSESLEEAEAQLRKLAPLLAGQVLPSSPSSLPGWLDGLLPKAGCLASVRCGVEMAVLHVSAQQTGLGLSGVLARLKPPTAQLVQASYIRINALRGRGGADGVRGHGPGGRAEVVKVKVGGGGVQQDVDRVNAMLRQPGARLRLDANQAWTMEEVRGGGRQSCRREGGARGLSTWFSVTGRRCRSCGSWSVPRPSSTSRSLSRTPCSCRSSTSRPDGPSGSRWTRACRASSRPPGTVCWRWRA